MKFFTFRDTRGSGLGLVSQNNKLLGFWQEDEHFPGDLHTLLTQGGDSLAAAAASLERHGKELAEADITYLPPIPKPNKILCIGLNYRQHAYEANMSIPTHVNVFARFATSLVGAGQPVILPKESEQFDYEAEFAVIIGKGGRRISAAHALGHVAGYSLFNDVSVRDVQLRTSQWVLGKNFDATGAFGPCLVTADELPAGCQGLRLTATLNGEVVQDGTTDDLIFDVSTAIEQISAAVTLEPGDVIITGTPAGVGMARKPPRWMKAGDTIEIAMEGLGRLSNKVKAE
ncbi:MULTISPECIES: fumarylacetoacetate hydrolase family protein [unclassified Shinella]|uniref:fumarylacetoacetate hydrolase family protein n=1 Tax=unclassified Shinella TaxID=2643062 RepID=UPI00234F0130|nr:MULTISPECIES: fumarylacetoacetate hydrolase family protein [unclassified Shinella]MCO5149269.1 fumarylacetoacetate hydrolase family protein [Shinella sp.]MDC7265323.1 fumarylacetoacetate hydrolase family protein [Shinella sp. HY16]MDC7272220.1 fumarylacetoacetate hydrolase family protein [Shinella sp. YZ44]